jgi:hypothetical protein
MGTQPYVLEHIQTPVYTHTRTHTRLPNCLSFGFSTRMNGIFIHGRSKPEQSLPVVLAYLLPIFLPTLTDVCVFTDSSM